ncbi:MAG: amidohydrolase [Clostridia bacterium]
MKARIREAIGELEPQLVELNRWMYENPEVGFREYGAADRLTEVLEEAGFEVDRGAADMETAFIARYGPEGAHPAVALFAEYDALPDIGHACGHNIIAAAALGAALALVRAWPDFPGSLYVYGAPAEEQSSPVGDCGGKAYLVKRGTLAGIDAAMMFHPSNHDSAYSHMLAVQPVKMTFRGKTAQPAGSAHLGINAFEAAVLAYTNINAIRQYLEPDHYVHGMIEESGPAPNIMSPRSTVKLHVRAPTNQKLEALLQKVLRCGEAVTGAGVGFDYYMPRYKEVVNNPTLTALLEENLRRLGRDPEPMPPRPRASTDMGNVSQEVPGVHAYISLGPEERVGNTHSPDFAPSTVTEAGERALLDAASALAMTTADLFADPDLVRRANEEFRAWREGVER